MNAWQHARRRIIQTSTTLAIIAMLISAPIASAQQAAPDSAVIMSAADRAFAIDLYKQVARDNPQVNRNLILSPFSISTAFAMAAEGAQGRTAEQINFALYFSDAIRMMQRADQPSAETDLSPVHQVMQQFTAQFNAPSRGPTTAPATAPTTAPYTLAVSNALWVEQSYSLKEAYLRTVEQYYGTDRVNPLDFRTRPEPSRQFINLAVAAQTRQKIRDFLPASAITNNTRMLLTNAVYFKGNWTDAFPQSGTARRLFRQDSTHDMQTMLMHDSSMSLPYYENDQVQAIALPYSGGDVTGQDLCMVVLLPRRVDGLASLESSLLLRRVDEWFSSMVVKTVDVYLPRFKAGMQLDLVRTLGTLGIRDAFSMENANFSGMTSTAGADRLYLNAVVHQTSVEVDEQGSEAAAATAIVGGSFGSSSIPREVRPVLFRADHPFIFMIYHNPTGTILFIGRVSNPA